MRNVALLHGCNLNMLGVRDALHYGDVTLQTLEAMTVEKGRALGLDVITFQTNHEGALIEKIHELRQVTGGIMINPGAWTHYSYGIRDALEMVEAPVVEVHLSDIDAREEWRRVSVIRDVCALTISGKGPQGYAEALEWIASRER